MTAYINKLKDKTGNQQLPVTHERAVRDDNGTTLETKLQNLEGAMDKAYVAQSDNGMGRITLHKNMVSGVNTLTQSMMQATNTIYIIKYDFVLGADITVPENCVLCFEGGSLTGSSLTGNNTFVNINQSTPIFNNIKMLGSFHAKEFPLNLYSTTKIDYLYTLLQSFSGTNFILNADYSVTETDNTVDGTSPHTLNLDGNGYKLTLHSFGAYNMTKCSIKNITIEVQNNSVGAWHLDVFKFGLLGYFATSTLSLYNVTLTSGAGRIYTRGFKSTYISNCIEDGVGFYVATTHCVTVKNCRVVNADNGYYQINDNITPDNEDYTIIDNCYFKNITNGGIILSGGIKMNPSITNCTLINVGSGGATEAAINMHPKGVVTIQNNYIVANVSASSLDIDASRSDMFDANTCVLIEGNYIKNTTNDDTIHSIAVVGLGNLIFRNNYIENQQISYWNTARMMFEDNEVKFTMLLDSNYRIMACMRGDSFAKANRWNHVLKHNIFNFKVKGSARIMTGTSVDALDLYGIDNIYTAKLEFVNYHPESNNIYGDIFVYDNAYAQTKHIQGDLTYQTYTESNAGENAELYPLGLKQYSAYLNQEVRGSYLGRCDGKGNPVGTKYLGVTADRPTLCIPGTAFFDKTIGKTIYARGTHAQMQVVITSELSINQAGYNEDQIYIYMKNFVCPSRNFVVTTSAASESAITEHAFDFLSGDKRFVHTRNMDDHILTVGSMYVGAVGSDYDVQHTNTVDGFTTTHSLTIDGSIYWVEEDGAKAGVARSGVFAGKPAANDIYVGFKYFCTDKQTTEGATNGIEIIHKGSGVWVDALGRVVS